MTTNQSDYFDDNICDFCGKDFKTDMGLRIHFGRVHAKAQCADDKHEYDQFGRCVKENCGIRRHWVNI